MNEEQIRKFYENQLDIPEHKVRYILGVSDTSFLAGTFGGITHYGVDMTEEVFQILFEVVSAKLTGGYDVEYEFSENEYKNIMSLKNYCKKVKQ